MQLKITFNIRPDYRCNTCLCTVEGTKTFIENFNFLFEGLKILKKYEQYPPPSGMPIGWACFGGNLFRCDKCKV